MQTAHMIQELGHQPNTLVFDVFLSETQLSHENHTVSSRSWSFTTEDNQILLVATLTDESKAPHANWLDLLVLELTQMDSDGPNWISKSIVIKNGP